MNVKKKHTIVALMDIAVTLLVATPVPVMLDTLEMALPVLVCTTQP